MLKNVDKMGVLVLVSHLVITLAILALYAVFAYMGKPLTTIENMLLVIVGYWFGAIGTNAIRPSNQTQIQQANEVKVEAPKGEQNETIS